MRGKARRWMAPRSIRRIIPAGAGKRPRRCAGRPGPWDHPRGCGEKMIRSNAGEADRGSSPRVRGKVLQGELAERRPRIIPAGAGKSRRDPRIDERARDHPRGCGEKERVAVLEAKCQGSSPRVRGKVDLLGRVLRVHRIIPAGAGKRSQTSNTMLQTRDHPRGCGEKR